LTFLKIFENFIQFLALFHQVWDLSSWTKPMGNIVQIFYPLNPKKTLKSIRKAAKKPPLGVIF